MSIVLYYGSGSPYAWRVQLALEHKALPYERKVLSFSAGDTRKPEFLALNPRHRVPVLVDGDFVLYESNAIVEYLDEAYPATGAPLFPGDVRTRALVRRLIMEVDSYFDDAIDPLTTQAFSKKPEERDPQEIAEGPPGGHRRDRAVHQGDARRVSRGSAVGRRFRALSDGRLSQALRAEAARPRRRRHAHARAPGVEGPDRERCRISTRPFRRTGNKAEATAMELSTTAFANNGVIPARIRVRRDGRRGARETVGQSQSRFRVDRIAGGHASRWRCCATIRTSRRAATTSTRRAGPCRHRCRAWISSTGCSSTCRRTRRRSRAANSRTALRRAERPGPHAPRGARQGINDYTGWFAGDKDMAGNYFGYDGPCPPWNDEIPHRYVFTLYALDVPRLDVGGRVHRSRCARRRWPGTFSARRPSPAATR